MSDRLALAIQRAIRAERSRQGLSQQELADRLGVSRQVVWNMEAGTRTVALAEAPDLCRALGVPLARLLVDADPEDLDALGL